MEWCRLWWLFSSVVYNKPTVEQLNLFPLPLCPFHFLLKPKTHEKRFFPLLLCSSGKKDNSAWRSWRFGGKIIDHKVQGKWVQEAGRLQSRTQICFPDKVFCTKVEAAPKGKQIKVLNTQGLLWRCSPLVNRLILTLGLRACCFLTSIR